MNRRAGRFGGWRRVLLLASLAAAAGPVLVQAAEGPAREQDGSDELRCGGAVIRANTRRLLLPEVPSQVLGQTLQLTTLEGKSMPLPHDGRPVRKALAGKTPVLDGRVVSWACLDAGRTPPYILLAYECSWGEERGDCAAGRKEWNRLFSTDGRHLTAGLRRHDQRYDKLLQREGLAKVMEAGVSLTGLDH